MAKSSSPGAPAPPQMTLLRRFTLLSALILFVGAALIGWWVDRRIYQLVTEDSIELTGVFVNSTIAPHLVEMPVVNALTLSQAAHLQTLIANNVASGRYAAVNLWSPAEELIFSTLSSPSAQPQSLAGLRAAAAGEVFTYATDTLLTTEPVTGARVTGARVTGTPAQGAGPFLESYFPVMGEDGAPLAIVDFYQNLAELERSALKVRLQTWAVVGSATVLMYFLLFGIVRQGGDTIEAQQSALAQSRRQIQQAAVRAAALNEAAMRRLGADLHDGPAQDLGMARMRIEPLRAQVEQQITIPGAEPFDLNGAAYDLQLIDTALQSSLQEIRNLASGLRLLSLTAPGSARPPSLA